MLCAHACSHVKKLDKWLIVTGHVKVSFFPVEPVSYSQVRVMSRPSGHQMIKHVTFWQKKFCRNGDYYSLCKWHTNVQL
jgi:hypothetical protein